jgi:hypothetical protein
MEIYMNDLNKMRDNLYKETKIQRQNAWKEKDYKKAVAIRKKEQETFKKWEFVKKFIDAKRKEDE